MVDKETNKKYGRSSRNRRNGLQVCVGAGDRMVADDGERETYKRGRKHSSRRPYRERSHIRSRERRTDSEER